MKNIRPTLPRIKQPGPLEILAARVAVLEQRADNTDRDLLGLWSLAMSAKRLAGRMLERAAGFGFGMGARN